MFTKSWSRDQVMQRAYYPGSKEIKYEKITSGTKDRANWCGKTLLQNDINMQEKEL